MKKKQEPNPADFHPFNEASFDRMLGKILAAKPQHRKAPKKGKPKPAKK